MSKIARNASVLSLVLGGVLSFNVQAESPLDLRYKVGIMGLDEFSTTPITLTVTNQTNQPMKNVVIRANKAVSLYFKNNKIDVGDLRPDESRKVTAYLTAPVLRGDDLQVWDAEYQSKGETVSAKVVASK